MITGCRAVAAWRLAWPACDSQQPRRGRTRRTSAGCACWSIPRTSLRRGPGANRERGYRRSGSHRRGIEATACPHVRGGRSPRMYACLHAPYSGSSPATSARRSASRSASLTYAATSARSMTGHDVDVAHDPASFRLCPRDLDVGDLADLDAGRLHHRLADAEREAATSGRHDVRDEVGRLQSTPRARLLEAAQGRDVGRRDVDHREAGPLLGAPVADLAREQERSRAVASALGRRLPFPMLTRA